MRIVKYGNFRICLSDVAAFFQTKYEVQRTSSVGFGSQTASSDTDRKVLCVKPLPWRLPIHASEFAAELRGANIADG